LIFSPLPFAAALFRRRCHAAADTLLPAEILRRLLSFLACYSLRAIAGAADADIFAMLITLFAVSPRYYATPRY